MQLFYDKGMIMHEHEGSFYFYSPGNHVRAVVNEYSRHLIDQILLTEGWVDLEKIVASFWEAYHVELTTDAVMEQIHRLLKMGLFFRSSEEFQIAREQLLSRFQIKDKVPGLAYLLLTYRCNFDCFYCYLRDTHKAVQELTTEEWIAAIRELKRLGIQQFCVTGGEPLCREDLVPILQELKRDSEVQVTLLTNGSLLKDRFDEVDPFIDRLVVSLDSFDPATQTVNRSSYGFQEILDVIERYSKTAPEKIKVRAVVTKENLDQMTEFTRRLNNEYGIRTIRSLVNPIRPDETDIVPDLAGRLEMDRDRREPLNYAMKYRKCGACYSVIALNPAGDVMPCQALMNPEFRMTNIFAENWFETFLQSDVRQRFTALNLDKMEKCKDCSYRYLCGGCCPAVAYNLYGELEQHVPSFCDYLKEKAVYTLLLAEGRWEDVPSE